MTQPETFSMSLIKLNLNDEALTAVERPALILYDEARIDVRCDLPASPLQLQEVLLVTRHHHEPAAGSDARLHETQVLKELTL